MGLMEYKGLLFYINRDKNRFTVHLSLSPDFDETVAVDENGRKIKFKSYAAALAYIRMFL